MIIVSCTVLTMCLSLGLMLQIVLDPKSLERLYDLQFFLTLMICKKLRVQLHENKPFLAFCSEKLNLNTTLKALYTKC